MHDPIPNLAHAVKQLEEWGRSNMSGREEMMLSWAQCSHYWATMALAEAQDKYYNGGKND